MKTKVLFRMFKGEVLALFPQIPGSVGKPWQCESYAHVGQHAAADYCGVIQSSRPATHDEYAPLYRELRRIGYELEVVRRCSPADTAARVQECR